MQSDPDEPVDDAAPIDLALGSYCYITGLKSRPDLNGRVVLLDMEGEDGRWDALLLPEGTESVRVKPGNMKKTTEKGIMKLFKYTVCVDSTKYVATGSPQGSKTPLIRIMVGSAQFGMVSSKGIGALKAFHLAVQLMDEMAQKSMANTKEAFYLRRDELVAVAVAGTMAD